MMMMFSRPPGYGDMPEPADQYADSRGEIIAGEPGPTARALASAMAQLWAARYGWPEPGPRPESSEGGHGRAVPHNRGLGDLAADLAEWAAVADTGEESPWAQRPRR
jgi:hypothetical protein